MLTKLLGPAPQRWWARNAGGDVSGPPGSQETDPIKDEIVSSHSPKSAKEVFLTAVEHLARVVPGGAPQPNFFLGS